ncbi:MAG TPA: YdeI/OmpD-associated family protein [Terriglobales bacterium]|nr:YdeI/OmpD-associated family protein [Terriglobales bacterium]
MAEGAVQKFRAKLTGQGEGKAWTILVPPFSVEKTWGTKARVPVKGTINGYPIRCSLFPMGNGKHCIMVNKEMQKGAGATQGDTVSVVLEPDAAPRTVAVPPVLKKALARNKGAQAYFDKLSPSHKKAYVDFITEAKKEETRQRRVEKTLAMLAAGKKIM